MKDFEFEKILNEELEEVKGGSGSPKDDTCICVEGGAAAVVIIEEPGEEPDDE